MQKLILPVIFLSFFLLLAVSTARSTYAQESALNLTVSPVFLEYTPKGGEVIKDKIRIRNNSSSPVILKATVNKLAADHTGRIAIDDTSSDDSYLSWVTLEKDNIAAPPREWIDVPFAITVPEEAAFGYYMALALSTENHESTDNAVSLTGMTLVPILLNVQKDGAKAEAKLIEFKSKSFINEYLPIEFVTSVQNSGNVHIRPRGNIFISGQGNKDLAILEVNEHMGTILPQAMSTYLSGWNDGFIVNEPIIEDGETKLDENGNVMKKFTVNWDKLTHFRFGKYTAHLFLVFDDGKKDVVIEGTTSFWVIPYRILGTGILILIMIALITRFILKLYIQKEVKRRMSK